ncbi:hypothetical protein HC251_04300 [Iamia sp. SCSIO 61187]|uniref:hypothetical protein n=1 Tax=Iamia sp. SCSIO 61187 TaxID=2722752 RepID=UPI001C63463D|nr:hypothetical protein [Iamia sp. SCSIO 61187]QYG91734.1 hypothetical protein HC251_04300 [Iamia sp. SCSIO 61187]
MTSSSASHGGCGSSCGCAPSTPRAPIACSLDGPAVPDRLKEWAAALRPVVDRTPIDGGLRLSFSSEVDLAALASLAAAEQRCCPFFYFSLTIDERGIALEVTAPDDAAAVVGALFGEAA